MKRVSGGFTLLEMIALMVFISAGLVAISAIFANNNFALTQSQDYQNAVQYAQECADRVLSVKRNYGFTSTCISTTMCDQTCGGTVWGSSGTTAAALPTGFTRTVTVPATYTGSSTTPCPNGATCRDVTVSVTKGNATSSVTVLLVNY
jgi:type II secretory pathway pseudopilin PulG